MNVPKSLGLLGICLSLLLGCKEEKPVAMAPPPPKVTVAKPVVRDVDQWDDYDGSLFAVETVDLKAQVSGEVESVTFSEGALVNKGDVLLTIDSRIFRAQLESAQGVLAQNRAKLEQSKAVLELSKNDLKREQEAASKGVATSSELEAQASKVAENAAAISENEALIATAEAAVKVAQLNVDWCKVTAPITGRISSKDVTAGNMITAAATHITTITSVSPIYCYVNADEASVLKYQRLAREKRRISAADSPIPCYMGLDNEVGFPHIGVIDFVDNQIKSATGTRRARGVFDNPDGTLLPGFHARFRVVGETYKDALLVIDDAIGSDQDRHFIWIMHPDKTIERRAVTIGPLDGEQRIVFSNLKPDEWVIVNGIVSVANVPKNGVVDPVITPMPERRLGAAPPASPSPATSSTAPSTSTSAPSATRGENAP